MKFRFTLNQIRPGDAFYTGRGQWRVFCNNGFDWLNWNKHIAVFHTEAYRWAQKSVFLVGLKLILVGLKLILVALKIILVGLKIILVGLKLILVNFSGTKINFSPTNIIFSPTNIIFSPTNIIFSATKNTDFWA